MIDVNHSYLICPLNVANIIQTSLDFCFRSISRFSYYFHHQINHESCLRDPFPQSDRLIAIGSVFRIFHQSFLINKRHLRDAQCSFLLVACLVTGGIAGHFARSEENTWEERVRRGVDVEIRVEAGRCGAPRVALQAQRSMHPRSPPSAAAVVGELHVAPRPSPGK